MLALLASDLSGSGADAYIRIERLPKEEHPHIGYIVFRNGQPLLAMHQAEDSTHAVDALLEIESDAAAFDCLLTIHRNIDVDLLVQTFSSSLLDLEFETDSDSDSIVWWRSKSRSARSWTRVDTTEEKIRTPSGAEVLDRAVEARLRRLSSGLSDELLPGYAHLICSDDPSQTFELAALLQALRHPTLIISRQPVADLAIDHRLESDDCLWLTERNAPDEQTIEPQLESLYMVIKTHLDTHERSVLVLDGFEFLHAIHGFERVLDFLRRLCDIATTSDDLTLIPIDLDVFDSRQQALIRRELDPLDDELLRKWLDSPEDLEGHRFHLPDKEEDHWDDQLQAKSIELALAEEEELRAQPSLAELVDASPVVQRPPEGMVNRLDLAAIMQDIDVEEVSEEDMSGVVHFRISDVDDSAEVSNVQKEVSEVPEEQEEPSSKGRGPRRPVVVRRAERRGLRTVRKGPASRGSSGLDQVSRILDNRDQSGSSESKHSRIDRSRTYRQYYDTHRHKKD